ncbi:MAG: thioredoxin family protein [FCB group bacterium]|nr:thioredoxin family protein [FCB group bacterium]MBL7029385.1 thioredoxin family protein [Candidatus Neomarinimicrobiota bacterium]MBL7123113.1 thioredoxin family protein [Candidatus Neomarinimicrobiota bacterium]
MRLKHIMISVLTLLIAITGFSQDLKVGKTAPDFSLNDPSGKAHQLQEYRGKYVVLEWVNYDCPFVKKHYDSGNMQALQSTYTARDVVWLSINSSAPGKQGNFTSKEILRRAKEHSAAFSAYLIDADGKVGKAYGARTTPHMFIIDPEGQLVYAGGIDNIRSTKVEDIPRAKNFVSLALEEALAGQPITNSISKPYGCSVKY